VNGRDIEDQVARAYQLLKTTAAWDVVKKDLEYYANMDCHVPGDSHTSAYNEGKRVMARNFLLLTEERNDE